MRNKKPALVRIPLRKGTLSGYHMIQRPTVRHKILKKLINSGRVGKLVAFRKLNALAIMNKNRYPQKTELLNRDKNWVKKNVRPIGRFS